MQVWCKFSNLHHGINRFCNMASVTAFIRVSRKRIDRANVRFRLRDGRNIQLFHVSELEINPSDWDAARQEIKAKVLYDAEKRVMFNKAVADRKNMMLEIYNAAPSTETLTSDWLDQEIDKHLHPEKYIIEEHRQTFFEAYEEFIEKRKLSDWRVRAIQVVIRALRRGKSSVSCPLKPSDSAPLC